jgi:hypothetical protein
VPGVADRLVDMYCRRMHLSGELLQGVHVHASCVAAPYPLAPLGRQRRLGTRESTGYPVERKKLLLQHEIHPASAH